MLGRVQASPLSAKNPENWDALDRLRHLLDHWQDVFDAPISNSQPKGARSSSSSHSPPPLPKMAGEDCVRKIERALTTLADSEPVLARHLKAYRCNAEWRTRDTGKWVLAVDDSGPTLVPQRERVRIVPKWVSVAKVVQAERLLLKLVHHDVSLPAPLWKALTT